MDNISFHHETGASRLKFVYHRILSLEKELGKKALECQELVDIITDAGLIKTVWGLGNCYEKLVKEFLVNIGTDCDDPMSPEYMKVFVRGCCVDFSPSVINQYLGRSTEKVAELKATDDEICRILTGNLIKK
ncbi:envelope-like protein [Trifolium medium]|uniref:Envelope-like protein n=1 Tax=Trifolium medium TaxID=97028 RepID=A0A392Q9L3_9FABA|nr:envelope-like protein [Trifolium medium]